MDPFVIISPHMDDALLSCGQLMAGRPDITVVSVFTGVPERRRMLTSYDRNCGFRSAVDAVTQRKREDEAATRLVDAAPPVWLEFVDNQYALTWSSSEELDLIVGIADALGRVVDESGAATVVGPLGLAHPDHHRTMRAWEIVATARPHLDAWLYADQPSTALYPWLVSPALDWWRGMGHQPTIGFLGTGPVERKEQAVACYRSQLWALNRYAYLAPEHVWCLRGEAAT